MSNIIDSIRMSGTTYAISDSGGTKVVEITQSDYDNLPTSAKTANIMYVITDAEPFDVSNYYTKAETSGATELATAFAATQPKLSAGTNITIDANNVISAEGGGGGKAVSGGTNISITTGETADTINCTLNVKNGTNNGIIVGDSECSASGSYAIAIGHNADVNGSYSLCVGSNSNCNGQQSIVFGDGSNSRSDFNYCFGRSLRPNKSFQFLEGSNLHNNNEYEVAFGQYNVSSMSSYTYGNSGNTLFSIGNGYDFSSTHNWHNAFEIRQNGDIYIANTNDTSITGDKAYSLYPMIKLQDVIGGGGGGIDSGTVQTMIDQSISGKTNQTDFVSHSGNSSIHVTTAQTASWDAKSDFSGSYNDLTDKPTIPSKTSDLTNDSNFATSGYVDSAISGKQDVSGMTAYTTTSTTNTLSGTVTAHTADTAIHVTAQDKTNWNNKSNFSGDYNDLTNKPTIPTVPTNVSDFTNDAGYATSGYVQSVTSDMATKTWVGQQGYLTQHQDISGKQDVSGMTAYTETSAFTAHTADTTIHVTTAQTASWDGAVSDISTISGNVSTISGDVASLSGDVATVSGAIPTTYVNSIQADTDASYQRFYRFSTPSNFNYFILRNAKINGRQVLNAGWSSDVNEYSLVETSAITTSITSSSTDAQVPSAKAVNDKLGGLSIVKLSQSEYDNLSTKDNSTLYVIVN